MTTEYTVILPLMITSIIALIISSRLLNGSNIYTLKLIRRGIDIFGGKDINVLDKISVSTLKKKIVDTVPQTMTLQELLEKISVSAASNFYVKDENNRLSGIITHSAMRRYLNHHEDIPVDATVKDMMNRQFEIISDITPVHEVLRKMIEMDLEAMPVVDEDLKLNGEVERSAIVHQYQELLIHAESAKAVAHSMKFIQKQYHEKTEVLPGFFIARINAPSTFVNQSLKSLNVRQTYGVDILLIRREDRDIIPEVNDKLKLADQLLVFGEQVRVEALCELL